MSLYFLLHYHNLSIGFSFFLEVSATFLVSSLFTFLQNLQLIIRIYKDRSEVIKKFLSNNLIMSYLVLSTST